MGDRRDRVSRLPAGAIEASPSEVRDRLRVSTSTVGFELITLGAEGDRRGLYRGPRRELRVDDEQQVAAVLAGLLSRALRRRSDPRLATVGLMLDCDWAELSTVLATSARTRELAAGWGMRFLVRASIGRMMVTVVGLEDDAARRREGLAKRGRGQA